MPQEKTKYPRTFHLPYSLTVSADDKRLPSDQHLNGMDIVMTEKMDGENTNVYPNGDIHARSIDGNHTPWQSWLRKDASRWSFDIPEKWKVCGENLYAKHSIEYTFQRPSQYFQAFSIWNEDSCLPWDSFVEWCNILGIEHVPVIYTGKYDQKTILKTFQDYKTTQNREVEGFVVRNTSGFDIKDFNSNVAKFVRAGHVTTDEHWTKNWTVNPIKTLG